MKSLPLVVSLACLALSVRATAQVAGPAGANAEGSPARQLQALIDEHWQWVLRENPTFATSIGDDRYDDRLEDLSPAAIERRDAETRRFLERARAIDPAHLAEDARLNHQLFVYNLQEAVAGQRFPFEVLPINQLYGVHRELANVAEIIPKTPASLKAFIERIRAYPTYIDQSIALMQRGLELGVTPPRVTLRDVATLIGNQIAEDPTQTPIYQVAFADVKEPALRAAGRKVIAQHALPALRKLKTFVADTYVSNAREAIAQSALPDGKDWYAYMVAQATTTDLTPEQIHRIGLAEVKRIRADMQAVMRRTGWKGDLASFFVHLRSDPRFFFTEKDALLQGYRDIAKRIDPMLPKLFGKLPRLTYGVLPVPAHAEATQTTAYYRPGAPEVGRAGYFFANTYDLPTRPKWEMEALTLHEAVPGHHLQIALAQELTDVPEFRRHEGYGAFVEGWGLYAESLGPELGMFADPYMRFGQLTYEMWRAIRLVVDTGMHAKGWSRQQAIDYFKQNAGKSEHDIIVEVDRYIVWPGQALSYKIGELKLKELRRAAEKKLGTRFDIRAFHDLVLGAGALPLSVLERRVSAWIETRPRR